EPPPPAVLQDHPGRPRTPTRREDPASNRCAVPLRALPPRSPPHAGAAEPEVRAAPAWRPPGRPGRLPQLRPPGCWACYGSCPPPQARTRSNPKINDATQEPVNCTNYTAHVPCFPAPNITCKDFGGNETHFTGREVGFFKPISCRNVNGYSYKVAVALSLFLGWLGADRFYLGYPALGLLKFCTVGFCGIGSLIDFILISMQIVGPSDGSSYIIDYYGTRLTRLSITNETFRKTQLYP
uniref:TM2 domain containing 1 n=1 Tax=Equus caballus TaxID=9796 RepID=A0A9L0SN45_HORSE